MANNNNQQTNKTADTEKEQLLKQIEELQKAAKAAEDRAAAAEKSTADAEAKLAELESKAAAGAAKLATPDEREEIFVPKGYANDEPNLFIGVNGVNYLLPKGKKSLVPKCVAEEFRRSVKAQQIRDDNVDAMRSKE